ncbi:MAG: hypothetical protein CMJ59_18040 [Planctomycetaceae bacterium]|nr:hypothetical protein [Planctomycetaceae bacterium]
MACYAPSGSPILEEAYELAPVGAVYVVGGGYRDAALSKEGWKNCNLRTQFQRILKRAGVASWLVPFQNLRAQPRNRTGPRVSAARGHQVAGQYAAGGAEALSAGYRRRF